MNMRMVQQILSPGVQHAEEADFRTEMLRIGGDGVQRLRRRPEQDIIDQGLVLERNGGDQVRNGEHDMEVGHVEKLRLTVLEPLRPCQTLALRTIAIAARVVGDALVAAIAATLNMTAEGGGAAPLDRGHGTPSRSGQRRAMAIAKSWRHHFQRVQWTGGGA